ncbi:hypothetical protein [Belnapia moabensis]|uniref:hypothetical protein n=1 Tax=Belnapia moabensis TaxID=365533 RepID=UPI0005B99991|nr:hypothetical protein [Belnapia moabensis]
MIQEMRIQFLRADLALKAATAGLLAVADRLLSLDHCTRARLLHNVMHAGAQREQAERWLLARDPQWLEDWAAVRITQEEIDRLLEVAA